MRYSDGFSLNRSSSVDMLEKVMDFAKDFRKSNLYLGTKKKSLQDSVNSYLVDAFKSILPLGTLVQIDRNTPRFRVDRLNHDQNDDEPSLFRVEGDIYITFDHKVSSNEKKKLEANFRKTQSRWNKVVFIEGPKGRSPFEVSAFVSLSYF